MRQSRQRAGLNVERSVLSASNVEVHPHVNKTSWNRSITKEIAKAGNNYKWGVAVDVFKKAKHKDTILYNAIMNAANKCGKHREGWFYFLEMKQEGVDADVVSNVEGIRCLARLGEYEQALSLWKEQMAQGIPKESEPFMFLAIINAAAQVGNVHAAVSHFNDMMDRGHTKPSLGHFGAVLNACRKARDAEHALRFIALMRESREQPSEVQYTTAMGALRGKPLEDVRALHAQCVKDKASQNQHYLEEYIASLLGVDLDAEDPSSVIRGVSRDRVLAARSELGDAKQRNIPLKKLLVRFDLALSKLGAGNLPHPWVQVFDESGTPYYWNRSTNETSWTPPTC